MNKSTALTLTALAVLGTAALGHAQPAKPAARQPAARKPAARKPAVGHSAKAAPASEVRAVASNPSAHLGHVVLTGYVGIATPSKGFVIVDNTEYRNEGLGCLTVPEPTKLPVIWHGGAPKVKDAVRVDGTLAKTAKGYTFTANKVSKS